MSMSVDESDLKDDIGGDDPGAGEMDLFAVCWRSAITPAKASIFRTFLSRSP